MSWWTSREIHPKTKSKFVVVFGGVFYLPNIKSLNKPKIEFDTKEYRLLNHKFNYPGNGTWQPITMKFVDMNGMGRQNDHFDTGAFLWQVLNNTGYTYPYVDNSQFRDPHFRNVNSKTADEFGGGHHISTKIKLDGDGKSWKTITTPEKSSTIANSFGLGLENFADFDNASVSKQRISIYQLAPFTGNEPEKRNAGREESTPQGAIITECWHLVNPIVKSVGWGDLAYDSDDLIEYELGVVYDWAIMDRTQIGKQFMVSALPYQEFMKTLFVDNEEAITQRKLEIANTAFDKPDRTITKIGDSIDLDGDGKISDLERKLSKDPNIIAATKDEVEASKKRIETALKALREQGNQAVEEARLKQLRDAREEAKELGITANREGLNPIEFKTIQNTSEPFAFDQEEQNEIYQTGIKEIKKEKLENEINTLEEQERKLMQDREEFYEQYERAAEEWGIDTTTAIGPLVTNTIGYGAGIADILVNTGGSGLKATIDLVKTELELEKKKEEKKKLDEE